MAMDLAPGGIANFAKIFESGNTSQISTWNRIYGKAETGKLIFVLLEDLNNYFNVARPMTTAQMTDLAIEFTTALQEFRMEEILAFFEGVKKQIYGKIYERFDPAILWEFLGDYNQSRENYFYSENTRFKQSDPSIENGESARLKRGFTGIAGAIDKMKSDLKKLN